jgi:transposase-like protein
LSLTARGLTTGEIAAHFEEVYGAKVGKDTISRITDAVVEAMAEWQNRPLDRGQIPLVVANPEVKGFGCRGMHRTRGRWRSSADTSS